MNRNLINLLAGTSLLLCCAITASAQSNAASSPESQTRFSTAIESPGRAVGGKWVVMGASAINSGDEDATVTGVSWFSQTPGLQFGREIAVPAGTRRQTWFPLLIPQKTPEGNSSAFDLNTVVVQQGSRGDVFQEGATQERVESRPYIISRKSPRIGFVSDDTEHELHLYVKLGDALRHQDPNAGMMSFQGPRLPPVVEGYDIASCLVISGNRLADDYSALEAIRTWIRRGGTAWLMLDHMTPFTIEQVLGDVVEISEIDRTSVTSLNVTSKNAGRTNTSTLEMEVPVDLIRMSVEGAEVVHTVNGWPSAFQLPLGQGQIICTTIGMEGLIVEPVNAVEGSVDNSRLYVPGTTTDLLNRITRHVTAPVIEPAKLQEYVQQQIGYRTPSRGWAGSVLLIYCGMLAGIALLARRRVGSGAAASFGFSPIVLVPAVTALAVAGLMSTTRSTATTQAIVAGQIIHAQRGQTELLVEGVVGMYSSESAEPAIGSTAGGMFLPDRTGMGANRWRILHSDLDDWRIDGLKLPPGLRFATLRHTVPTQGTQEAVVTFSDKGPAGRLTSGVALEDVVIASSTQFSLSAGVEADGSFSAAGDVLPPGEFLADTLVSSEQARRQAVYRHMFSGESRRTKFPQEPTLFGWSEPLKTGLGLQGDVEVGGAALYIIPVRIYRPEAGTQIHIPSPFLPYRAVADLKQGFGYAASFSNLSGLWMEVDRPAGNLLRFQLPKTLLPLELEHADLQIRISAPLREVIVLAGPLKKLVECHRADSFVGTTTIPLEKSVLQLDEDGGLHVAIRISDLQVDGDDEYETGTQDRNWHIDWIQLSIDGQIAAESK